MDTRSDGLVAELAVAVRAWGMTGADVENALYKAESAPSRARWRFDDVVRLGGATCPIDVWDPAALATDEGYHWAYAVYPAGVSS